VISSSNGSGVANNNLDLWWKDIISTTTAQTRELEIISSLISGATLQSQEIEND
jgi:hypothetical protein